jgi:hypothetical protein
MTRDRDRYVDKHTPRAGVPSFVEEEATGQCEGEELARIRSRRPTPTRLRKLEEDRDEDRRKHEALAREVTETRVLVGTMSGKLDTVLSHVTETHATERVRISSTTKTVASIVAAVGTALAAYLAGSAGCA